MKSRLSIICLPIILFFISNLTAQTGIIKGTVTDGVTKEEIIGANVILKDTPYGTATDLDGSFSIPNVPEGRYTLISSYIGFQSDSISVILNAGQELTINFILFESSNLLEVVTTTGVRKTSTDVAILNTIKQSRQIVSGLSAESIKRTLDSDASQVVKRIPGVTVIQDRFIVIRGLNERYNSSLLHNMNIPSLESDVRSFSFDMIPSNVIDQILIYKSPAPYLPGDFSGGTVKITTKSIPDENSTTFEISSSYRNGSSLQPFFTEQRRPWHWTGINDGSNNLPVDFPENLVGLSQDQIQAAGRSLPNNWSQQRYNSGMDYKIALTNNFRKDIGYKGMQIGNITSIQYSNAKTVFTTQNNAFEAYDFINDESKLRYAFTDMEYGQEIMAGIVHNWTWRINSNHVIESKNLYNQLTSHDFIDRLGTQIAQGFNQNNFSFFNEYRGLLSNQLIGTHKLFKDKTRVEWIGGYGYSFNDLPDYRRYRRNIVDIETMESVLFVPRGQTPDFLGKFYSSMRENIYSGAINLEHKFNMHSSSDFKPIVRAGALYEDRSRNFEARNLGYTRGFAFDEVLTQFPVDQIFLPENINPSTGIRLGENFSSSNFFNASNMLKAMYVSLDIPLNKFNLYGGFRYEDNTQSLRSPERFNEGPISPIEPVILEQRIILPSFTVSYELTSKSFLKFVYGKTVNRPEFREIAPFGFYDFTFDATVTGYQQLRNATIVNFDLRWELYPSANETVSIALFSKRFTDPIESLYGNFGSEQSTFLFRNTESAFARGIELDMRKSLTGLTKIAWLDRMAVMANISIIDSQVTLGEELSELLRAKDRPLQGQSSFIVNTGLFYSDLEKNLQINVLYNVIGKRILLVGAASIPDTYEMPRNVIDMSVNKGLTPRLGLKLGVKDLLNQEFLLLQDGNEDGIFDRKNDQIFRRFKPGSIFSLGLTYQLQ